MGTVEHDTRPVRHATPDLIRSIALPLGLVAYLAAALILVPVGAILHQALATGADADTESLIGLILFGMVAVVALVTVVPLTAVLLRGWLVRVSAERSTAVSVALHAGIGALLPLPFALYFWLSADATLAMSVTTLVALVGPACVGAGVAGGLAPRLAADARAARRSVAVSAALCAGVIVATVLWMVL